MISKCSITATVMSLILFVQCGKKSEPVTDNPIDDLAVEAQAPAVPNDLKVYCYTCHNPAAESHDKLIAPPLAAIKIRYQSQFLTKQEFVERMAEFVANPSKEKALMTRAVQRFGVMAKTPADAKVVHDLVEYIYSNKLETPTWFNAQSARDSIAAE